ncbi:MAG: hypothetical protein AAF609_09055 [Cyanobacteria bacterium P01_C01_bin.120]
MIPISSNRHSSVKRDVNRDRHQSLSAISINSELQMLEEMIAAGKISPMQKTIILHDQAATGRTIAEVLITRGWL